MFAGVVGFAGGFFLLLRISFSLYALPGSTPLLCWGCPCFQIFALNCGFCCCCCCCYLGCCRSGICVFGDLLRAGSGEMLNCLQAQNRASCPRPPPSWFEPRSEWYEGWPETPFIQTHGEKIVIVCHPTLFSSNLIFNAVMPA